MSAPRSRTKAGRPIRARPVIRLTVRRAQDHATGFMAPSLELSVSAPFVKAGPGPGWAAKQAGMFREDARGIAAALRSSLPGGTLDALLVELLQMRASQLIVPEPRHQRRRG